MNPPSVALNVHLTVEDDLRAVLGRGTALSDPESRRLHLTLYLSSFSTAAIPSVQRAVAELPAPPVGTALTFTGVEDSDGWTMLTVELTPSLRELAHAALLAVAPLRARDGRPPAWVRPESRQMALFRQFGSPNVLDTFAPHVTVGTPRRPASRPIALPTPFVCRCGPLGVAIADDEGQFSETLGGMS